MPTSKRLVIIFTRLKVIIHLQRLQPKEDTYQITIYYNLEITYYIGIPNRVTQARV
jgi:hypothetical protein